MATRSMTRSLSKPSTSSTKTSSEKTPSSEKTTSENRKEKRNKLLVKITKSKGIGINFQDVMDGVTTEYTYRKLFTSPKVPLAVPVVKKWRQPRTYFNGFEVSELLNSTHGHRFLPLKQRAFHAAVIIQRVCARKKSKNIIFRFLKSWIRWWLYNPIVGRRSEEAAKSFEEHRQNFI